jgi:hypothetical protein
MAPEGNLDVNSKVQLFIDDSEESGKALAIMMVGRKKFNVFVLNKDFQGCDFKPPTLFSLSGTFHGLAEIEIFERSKLE